MTNNIQNAAVKSWKHAGGLVGVFVLLLVSGCSHYSVDFYLAKNDFKAKGKSVAVISGTKEEHNVIIATMVSDSLRKKSKFQVTAPAQIAQSVKPYPQNIKGPYRSAYFQIDTDWDLGDRKKVADIQQALGVDYLYVIWAPIAVSSNGQAIYQVPAVAQLFEPSGNVVAKTNIGLIWGSEGNQLAKEATDEIALQMATKTGMALAVKK